MTVETNEGMRNNNLLKRLAFGEPRNRSAFFKVKTRNVDTDRPLVAESDYVHMTVATQQLTNRRFGLARYHPIFFGSGAFAQQYEAPFKYSNLIPALPNELVDVTDDVGGTQVGDRLLFPQTPYRGDIQVQLNLLSCKSLMLLKQAGAIVDQLRQSFGDEDVWDGEEDIGGPPTEDDDGYEMAPAEFANVVKGAARMFQVDRMLWDVGAAAIKALEITENRLEPRLEHAYPLSKLETGHYALYQVRANETPPTNLEYDPVEKRLYTGNSHVKRRNFAIIRVDASQRREDITQIPKLGEAYETLKLVFESGGQVAKALEKFKRTAQLTAYLTDHDRSQLISAVENKMSEASFRMSSAETNEGFSDLFNGRLQDLWATATHVAGQLVAAANTASSNTASSNTGSVATAPVDMPTTVETPEQVIAEPRDAVDRFSSSLAFTLRWEGGFVDHPADKGGATNFGVTEKVFHEWLADKEEEIRSVKTIKMEEVSDIYYSDYWLTARCDRLPSEVDAAHFDSAVNHGIRGAGRLLQRALADVGQAVRVDGRVGSKTLQAVTMVNPDELTLHYISQRKDLYHRIVDRNSSQSVFLKGWMNRANSLEHHVSISTNEAMSDIVAEHTPFAGWED